MSDQSVLPGCRMNAEKPVRLTNELYTEAIVGGRKIIHHIQRDFWVFLGGALPPHCQPNVSISLWLFLSKVCLINLLPYLSWQQNIFTKLVFPHWFLGGGSKMK